jgi:hypothetical protein
MLQGKEVSELKSRFKQLPELLHEKIKHWKA